jgi:hypothetical protein
MNTCRTVFRIQKARRDIETFLPNFEKQKSKRAIVCKGSEFLKKTGFERGVEEKKWRSRRFIYIRQWAAGG